ncbi:MAG: Coenzyme F420 hydrogenase/dehydrogenase, beta subunit C-terminal domain, partial [Planctomycetota bacterium]
RRRGSSGGVATALGVYGIEAGDAGGVLHIAAADDKPLVNKSVISRTPEELLERTGSRYAPASPLEGLGRLADESQPVVFIGKPCDVAGVTQLCRARPDVDEKVALTIGIFCAGTPSSTGTRKLLAKMGVKDPDAVTSMRYRGNGWPGMIVVTERLPDGTEARYEITYAEGWALLSKYRQWRCLICPDHVGEFADVAVGDPWYREIGPDEPGQSLILARTPRGRAFVERAIAAGAIVAEEVEPRLMRAAQEHLYRTRVAMWGRLLAMRLFGLPTPRFVNMRVWSNWLWLAGAKEKLISVAGTLRRLKRKGLLGPVRVVAESVATPFNRSRRTTADAATDQATEADGAIETSAPGANGVVSRH